jgi:phosphatidate cytidylyltransferase
MSPHAQRILTGLALILALAYFVFWATSLELALAVLALSGVGLWEFFSLFWPRWERLGLKAAGIALAVPVVLHGFLGVSVLVPVLFGLWVINAVFVLQYARGRPPDWPTLQIVSLGLLYVPVALQFLVGMAAEELLLVLLAASITDIFAFYSGSWWGRRRMLPAVSPKKSWVGSGGGLLGCLGVSLAIGLGLGTAPWPVWIGLGVSLNLAAQVGDFFVSALKRSRDVKDAGRIFPGHGGLLDRFDSVLLVIPAYMLFQAAWPLF